MALTTRNAASLAKLRVVPSQPTRAPSLRPGRRNAHRARQRTQATPSRQPTVIESQNAAPELRIGLDLSGLAVFERLFLRAPVRMLRAANNVLDLLFYDIHTIPTEKRRELLRWSDPDGSILVVHPGNGDQREVKHFEHIDKFIVSPEAKELDVVAIAGVGSSALGTAALAANVADAVNRPVVGIVSGYGFADALAEGLVGWFVLHRSNQLRQFIDAWLAPLTPALRKISSDTQPNGDPRRLVAYVRGLPETDCLNRLLSLPDSCIRKMIGHSKGNLSIAAALDNLTAEDWQKLCPRLTVTTLSALVQLPSVLAETRQFMGVLDGFGLLNSTLPQMALFVPWATHTLNTRLPFHLAARDALEQDDGQQAKPRSFGPASERTSTSRSDPSRLLSDWMDMWTGSAIAIGAAFDESLRSLRQGMEQAASGPRH